MIFGAFHMPASASRLTALEQPCSIVLEISLAPQRRAVVRKDAEVVLPTRLNDIDQHDVLRSLLVWYISAWTFENADMWHFQQYEDRWRISEAELSNLYT
jgi:hypothetical protein